MNDALPQVVASSWPMLPSRVAEGVARTLEHLSVQQARLGARLAHPSAVRSPGATHVDDVAVEHVQRAVRTAVDRLGWPAPLEPTAFESVDRALAAVLHDTVHPSMRDARDPRMWDFLSLIVLPDVALWRSRRLTLRAVAADDHVLGRLWWWVEVLGADLDPVTGEPLTDAELTALFRRRDLVADPVVARAIARAAVASGPADDGRAARLDGALRALLHASPVIDVQSLEPDDLAGLVQRCFAAAAPT